MYTCKIKYITLIYLVSGHSRNENDNANSVTEQISNKKTIYTPAEWEVIQCAFKKFKSVILDKTDEKMTEEEMSQQKALNESLGLAKRKVKKV